ncbi:MAG: hypothetical protein K2J40_03050 [Ruminococcus sp.]|nr:hypothetical protein [Ruminococcus sp.]
MLIWTLCAAVSIVFLLIMLYSVFNTKKRKLDEAFMFLMCAGFFSYFPHYINNYAFLNAVICDVVNLFQIVTLNSNSYEIYQPETTNIIIFYICIIIRGVVHITSPVLGTVTAYTFISKQFEKYRIMWISKGKKKVYIFSCCNDETIKIAECVAEKNEKSVALIFYETNKLDTALEEKLGYRKISHISHKIKLDVQSSKLPKIDTDKCELYFILANDSNENVELGLRLEDYYKSKNNFTDKVHIVVFSENSASDENVIDSIDTMFDLRIINKNKLFAYKLLSDKPLYEFIKDNQISVLITGFNALAKEVLFAVLSCGQMPNIMLKINIITENADAVQNYLKLYYPEILNTDYDINFFEDTVYSISYKNTIREHCMDTNYIVLCNEDDNLNIQTAVMLRRFFLIEDGKFMHKPLIAAYLGKDKKADVMKESKFDIYPFGYDAQIYSYDEIVNPELESLAKRVHFAYYETPAVADRAVYLNNIQSYYKLEYNRKSSLAMALSIKYKLWQMGFTLERCENGDIPDYDEFEKLKKYIAENNLDDFSEAEHRRWMAYIRTEGNSRMTVDEAEMIIRKNPPLMKKLGNSVYLGKHMDLIPQNEITTVTNEINERCKDIQNVAPKNDTTETDKDIIKKLPDILGNPDWKQYTGGYLYKVKSVKILKS